MSATDRMRALLGWYLDAGVDEAIGETPIDRYAGSVDQRPGDQRPGDQRAGDQRARNQRSRAPRPNARPTLSGEAAVESAVSLASRADSLDALRSALDAFEGCPLKKTATSLVFTDGVADARVLFIGEAPGAEEDRLGRPFVGASGKLLDHMLASIGLDRTNVLISNTVFWRPPGNRNPTSIEIAVCMPFVERLIELVDPRILIALGGAAAKSLLGESQGVGRLRGRWFSYSSPRLPRPIDAAAMFHPAYLLYSPAQKREAWHDLLALRDRLDGA